MEHREEVFFQDGTLGNIEEMNHLPERSELILIVGEKIEHYAMRREGALIIVEFEGEEVSVEAKPIKAPPIPEKIVTTMEEALSTEAKEIPRGVKSTPRKKKTEDTAKKLN